jgi:hypothetical protein
MPVVASSIERTHTEKTGSDSLFEQAVEDNPRKIGIVNPSTASEPTHLTIVDLVFFDDISALHHTLRVAYEQVPSESRHAFISQGLESWGLSKERAQLCASNLLTQNVEGSADFARTNAMHVMGSWFGASRKVQSGRGLVQ